MTATEFGLISLATRLFFSRRGLVSASSRLGQRGRAAGTPSAHRSSWTGHFEKICFHRCALAQPIDSKTSYFRTVGFFEVPYKRFNTRLRTIV